MSARSGGKIEAFGCDVTNEQAVLKLFKDVETKLGPVSVLVNNAGTATFTQITGF